MSLARWLLGTEHRQVNGWHDLRCAPHRPRAHQRPVDRQGLLEHLGRHALHPRVQGHRRGPGRAVLKPVEPRDLGTHPPRTDGRPHVNPPEKAAAQTATARRVAAGLSEAIRARVRLLPQP